MNQENYDKFTALRFIEKRNMVKRTTLTKNYLATYRKYNMITLYDMIDGLVNEGLLETFSEHVPGKRGPVPVIYRLTPQGKLWLREKRRQIKNFLRKVK